MQLTVVCLALLAALGAAAAPQASSISCTESSATVTTLFTAAATSPITGFTVYGYREGYDVVHQFWNAEGEKFYFGGVPSTYCPVSVQNLTGCPDGNVTAFSDLNDLVSAWQHTPYHHQQIRPDLSWLACTHNLRR